MPNTPIIYSSADVSAPILNETAGIAAGSLNYLMKAILVDGYGAKVAAGWTLASTDTATYAFLTGAGSSATYLIVEDLGTSASVSSAKTVTSLEPTVGTLVTSELVVRKNDATGTRSWWAMASARYIYLFIDTADTGYYGLSLFAGDLNSSKAGDVNQFLIAASSVSQPVGSCYFFTDTVGVNTSILNGYSTIVESTATLPIVSASAAIIKPFDTGGLGQPVGGGYGAWLVPDPVNYFYSLCCVAEQPSGTIRGFLPNAFFPWHSYPLSDDSLRDVGGYNIIAKGFDIDENGSFGEGSEGHKGQIWLDYESSF